MNAEKAPLQEPPQIARRYAIFLPYALAFTASFAVMLVEVVAGRLLSRHVGASLYSWTSVIGVVLGGISLGNLAGGWLADRFPSRKLLAILLFVAGALCVAIPLLDHKVADWSAWNVVSDRSWPLRVAIQVTAVFFLPAMTLGLVGPAVAKWALDLGVGTGRTVGNVYAWGALGSIGGTFCTGFYLVESLGSSGVNYAAGAVLATCGVILSPAAVLPVFVVSWPLLTGCVLGHYFYTHGEYREWTWSLGRPLVAERAAPGLIYTDESEYSYIKVVEEQATGVRHLCLDNLVHAQYKPGKIRELEYAYERIYAAVTQRFAREKEELRALFLGGGGYIFPRYLQEYWPHSRLQVAEIDPAVTEACFQAFDLRREQVRVRARLSSAKPELPGNGPPGKEPGDAGEAGAAPRPIEIYHLDARNHVEDLLRRKASAAEFEPFDVVYGDAFNDYSVPFHLVTLEFAGKIRELLDPETGLYLLNVIDIFVSGQFLGAICNTLRREFPHVYVFSSLPGGPSTNPSGRDTFIVIGSMRALDLTELGGRDGEMSFEGRQLNPEHMESLRSRSRGVVLTDDYSPVENLLEEVVRRKAQR